MGHLEGLVASWTLFAVLDFSKIYRYQANHRYCLRQQATAIQIALGCSSPPTITSSPSPSDISSPSSQNRGIGDMIKSIIPHIDTKGQTITGNPIEQGHQFALPSSASQLQQPQQQQAPDNNLMTNSDNNKF